MTDDQNPTPTAEPEASTATETEVQTPEFEELGSQVKSGNESVAVPERFYDVQVTLSAEIGRKAISMGELIGLSEGSVVELDRAINAPIDLMAQGVRVASGEVVVVNDCFAIRITDIDSEQQAKETK